MISQITTENTPLESTNCRTQVIMIKWRDYLLIMGFVASGIFLVIGIYASRCEPDC